MSRLAIAAVALVLVALAALPHPGSRSGLRLASAHGALKMLNSRPGAAILDVPRIAPGGSATGAVTVVNSGRTPAHLYLDSGRPSSRPGPNGGSLVERLDLAIVRQGGEAVAHGTLASTAGCHDLGMARAGETRTYRFTVRMPDGGSAPTPTTGDNAYAGSKAWVDERWLERSAGSGCGHPAAARGVAGGTATGGADPTPASAGSRAGGAGAAGHAPGGSLPFTGFPAVALAAIGIALAAIGAATRRRARRPPG